MGKRIFYIVNWEIKTPLSIASDKYEPKMNTEVFLDFNFALAKYYDVISNHVGELNAQVVDVSHTETIMSSGNFTLPYPF